MANYSMLNKLTELNDELLDLRNSIASSRLELLKHQEKIFRKMGKSYADKVLVEESKDASVKAVKKSEESLKSVNKVLAEFEKFKADVESNIKKSRTQFNKLISGVEAAESERDKSFKTKSKEHLKKIDDKISGFSIDNTDFKAELVKRFDSMEAENTRVIESIKNYNTKLSSEIKKKVTDIDDFTVSKMSEFYDSNKKFEKFMQEQVLKIDEELRKRFANEKSGVESEFRKIVEVINQFYEMYYSKVGKDELRVYQSAIDSIEKRLERLEGVREYENV